MATGHGLPISGARLGPTRRDDSGGNEGGALEIFNPRGDCGWKQSRPTNRMSGTVAHPHEDAETLGRGSQLSSAEAGCLLPCQLTGLACHAVR